MPWYIRLLRAIETGFFVLFFTHSPGEQHCNPLQRIPQMPPAATPRPVEFDFVSWTLNALEVKLGQAALDTPFYFNGTARHKIVVDYFHLIDNIHRMRTS